MVVRVPSANITGVPAETHLPDPKGPGIVAVPPLATGKKVSITLCPLTKGSLGVSFSL